MDGHDAFVALSQSSSTNVTPTILGGSDHVTHAYTAAVEAMEAVRMVNTAAAAGVRSMVNTLVNTASIQINTSPMVNTGENTHVAPPAYMSDTSSTTAQHHPGHDGFMVDFDHDSNVMVETTSSSSRDPAACGQHIMSSTTTTPAAAAAAGFGDDDEHIHDDDHIHDNDNHIHGNDDNQHEEDDKHLPPAPPNPHAHLQQQQEELHAVAQAAHAAQRQTPKHRVETTLPNTTTTTKGNTQGKGVRLGALGKQLSRRAGERAVALAVKSKAKLRRSMTDRHGASRYGGGYVAVGCVLGGWVHGC